MCAEAIAGVFVDPARRQQLTYCTNIHPGDGWTAVAANLATYAPPLKRRFAADAPFGLGLRLSARDAAELLTGDNLEAFAGWLDREGLYVALINGFPHGSFHRSVVKAEVYAPDWRTPERVRYTRDLIAVLGRLLPNGVEGGVSTAPLSYKAWLPADDAAGWRALVAHVVAVVSTLVQLRQRTGAFIHLDIEPEPDCSIENTDETIRFFHDWLLPYGAPALAAAIGGTVDAARAHLLDHVQVCFDCCHFAVEFEPASTAFDRLTAAGIRIGRIQLSSAIRVAVSPRGDADLEPAALTRLRAFADPVYLHQVVERSAASALRHFPDLPQALASASDAPREWRVHFHVPLFLRDYLELGSTQDYVREVLQLANARPLTHHLEIETYTWDVLPADLKLDLGESIAREYDWVLSARRA